jgi:cytochrome d ubiquinol oxidase subunit II
VPLGADGYFFEALWTNWRVGPDPGILDWYTVMAGVVALATLTLHGALYLATKTGGDVNDRARRVATYTWPVLLLLTFVSLVATTRVRLDVAANYKQYPIGLTIPILVFLSLAGVLHFHTAYREKAAFFCSCVYIAGMLGGAAFGLYPYVLPASGDPGYSLTIYNAAAAHRGLTIGITWWILGMALALAYFVFIYRMFKGKVVLEPGEGH